MTNKLNVAGDYSIWTTEFDEVIAAKDLVPMLYTGSAEEWDEASSRYIEHFTSFKPGSGLSGNAAAHCFTAQKMLEEALADVNPKGPISILVDNSGSMRGKGVTTAITFLEFAGRLLDKKGVDFEVLGFTTKEWKGGNSRKKYLEATMPLRHARDAANAEITEIYLKKGISMAQELSIEDQARVSEIKASMPQFTTPPGRLNDLRHIVYKSFDEPWSVKSIGPIILQGLLKENIDGEALLWARERLLERSGEGHSILHVGDGFPVDDSTLAFNRRKFLSDHLENVLSAIEKEGLVRVSSLHTLPNGLCSDERDSDIAAIWNLTTGLGDLLGVKIERPTQEKIMDDLSVVNGVHEVPGTDMIFVSTCVTFVEGIYSKDGFILPADKKSEALALRGRHPGTLKDFAITELDEEISFAVVRNLSVAAGLSLVKLMKRMPNATKRVTVQEHASPEP